jgi:hypothetical protein
MKINNKNNKGLKLFMLGLTLLSSPAFAKRESLSFTAAELTGNMTRKNLEHYPRITYRNIVGPCFGLSINIYGDTGYSFPIYGVTLGYDEVTINTAFIVERLDEATESLGLGRFQEVEAINSELSPIPDCASNAVFVLSRNY